MKKILFIFSLFASVWVFSQTLYSALEKKTIALGEPNIYKIRIDGLAGKNVEIAPKNELLPFHFEEISDATTLQGHSYERTIEFTVFEEGKFTIPSYDVKIGGETSRTISYELEVINTAQKGEQIND
ncbi:MAG: BatD family protein, partial [Cruoricaptor ignavus]|nr:BatD family protein [Cruoricaptor ignavus]